MPRQARVKSATATYHVMLRGVNKQRIFEQQDDYSHFIEIMRAVRHFNVDGSKANIPNCDYYAYCLMDNHVHMLIHEGASDIATVVKRISCAYALYFNNFHERVGHLFQDRFKSEPCENSAYLHTLYLYIHANPVKAGYVQSPLDYLWSSFRELSGEVVPNPVCSSPKDVFGQEPLVIYDPNIIPEVSLTDDTHEALNIHTIVELLLEYSNCATISEFQQLPKVEQQTTLAKLIAEGASLRSLSRITGLSLGIVRGSKHK